MKKKDKVISLETAKKLHELGVKVESECYWHRSIDATSKEWFLSESRYSNSYLKQFNIIQYPTYDVAELGEMVPFMRSEIDSNGSWMCTVAVNMSKHELFGYKTEAEVRGKMLIWSIENKHIKVEDIK